MTQTTQQAMIATGLPSQTGAIRLAVECPCPCQHEGGGGDRLTTMLMLGLYGGLPAAGFSAGEPSCVVARPSHCWWLGPGRCGEFWQHMLSWSPCTFAMWTLSTPSPTPLCVPAPLCCTHPPSIPLVPSPCAWTLVTTACRVRLED